MHVDQPTELVPVKEVVLGACRVDQVHRCLVIQGGVVAEHCHEGDDTRSASHEEYGPSVGSLRDEISADRSPQLKLVAELDDRREIGRHFAMVDADDGQLHSSGVRRRGNRVAPLRGVTVFCRQTHVDVLTRSVSGPVGDIETQADGVCGLRDGLGHRGHEPPHRSVPPVALFPPGAAVVVVSKRFPETGLVLVQ